MTAEQHAPVSTDGWMQTYTGRAFFPMAPRVADVDPLDIAHALAHICRYGGHTHAFYSVAEHCVLMSHWVEREAGAAAALWALLHDATEAYVGDVVRPLKRQMPDYTAAEAHLMDVICARFGLDPTTPAIVKEADNRILQNERAALLRPPPRPWESVEQLEPLPDVVVEAWRPEVAELKYLSRLASLTFDMGHRS